ncbi:MAG: XdhC family protein [Chloroflexi bacterium]|nr:XdhC family protein [Chloroflexota bacterium]
MSQSFFDQVHELNRAGAAFAIATVVRVEKPISAKSGDKAIIKADGTLDGWVGGGCAQDTIVREAKKAIREAQPRLLRLVGAGADADVRAGLVPAQGVSEFPITCHSGGTMDVYIEPVLPKPQLILLGNSPVAQTLAKLAHVLDFEIEVCDPQATPEQFPDAAHVFTEHNLQWLTVRPLSFVVISTQGHDDELALEAAARSNAAYIAMVASSKKFAGRAEYLRERGIREEHIARIKAPAGLDIGARTPDEIAASILAEMIRFRRQQFAPQQVEEAQAVAAVEELVAEAIDPVCGMTVEIATARYVSEYNGAKYYFCARSCMDSFNREPVKYVQGTVISHQ